LLGLYWPTNATHGPLGKLMKPESQQQCGLLGGEGFVQNGTAIEMK